MKRTLVIINENEHLIDAIKNNIKLLSENKIVDNIIVATENEAAKLDAVNDVSLSQIVFPNECSNMPKKRNWINRKFKEQNYDGMLYVVEDIVQFNESINAFLDKLENMMKVLDYSVWFNTIADGCNYVYKRYIPRVSINIDQPEFSKFNISKINFTSHSNTSFIAYDFSTVTDDQLLFNEQFDVPMYYIIEYLARRRNNKPNGSLFYMNQYLTIPEELGTFTTIKIDNKDKITQEQMQKEDAIFKSLNINYGSDNSIDQLLEQVYDKLKSKI